MSGNIEESLSSAERVIAAVGWLTPKQAYMPPEEVLAKMDELIQTIAFAYVDTDNRQERMEKRQEQSEASQELIRVLQAMAIDMAAIRAILERKRKQDEDEPAP